MVKGNIPPGDRIDHVVVSVDAGRFLPSGGQLSNTRGEIEKAEDDECGSARYAAVPGCVD